MSVEAAPTGESALAAAASPAVAYFSMEIGVDASLPTYSGGLGILAGDTLRAAADLGIPMVGVTLLYRGGYLRQRLDGAGNQSETPVDWRPEAVLEPMDARVAVTIEGRRVLVGAWRHCVRGASGHCVPVYFLDTDIPENAPQDRALTGRLYGGDQRYRLAQEIVLGLGGVAMVRAVAPTRPEVFHMNEGHSALLTLALLREHVEGDVSAVTPAVRDEICHRLVFTTHTPVPAGMDRFPLPLVRSMLGEDHARALQGAECCLDGALNMTYVALACSRYINGVALRHGEVSREMFPTYPISSITNGVHAETWVAPALARLYDRRIREWRHDNNYLRYAISIPPEEIRRAHAEAKAELLADVRRRTGRELGPATFTIGFARRAAAYKRADLLFTDLERLRKIAREVGPLQVIYAGKAHPQDEGGKALIRRVVAAANLLGNDVPVVYLEDYDMDLAKRLVAGVDVWLNTPQKPLEASGTSGMKAALNGVPSFSVLDGWWVEGWVEDVTGWSIGGDELGPSDPGAEAASLYEKLERRILPLFYAHPLGYAEVMRAAIAMNGSFFNTQRMMAQYLTNAYLHSHSER